MLLGLALLLPLVGASPQDTASRPAAHPQSLPPFLDLFKREADQPIVVREVTVPSAVGSVRGFLVRPATAEPLPAILLLPGEAGLGDWMKQNARDLCGIGYVVLILDVRQDRKDRLEKKGTVPLIQGDCPLFFRTLKASAKQGLQLAAVLADEHVLAEMSAAVRWLRRRPDVLPDHVGVLGWSTGAGQAVALAAATPLQACVLCDGPLTIEPSLLAGLHGTAVLAICAGQDEPARRALPAFRKAFVAARIAHKLLTYEGVQKGFMKAAGETPAGRAAEAAWVEIFEFLGKYVEDAPDQAPAPLLARKSVATMADIMRAVNAPTGVRGALIQVLAAEPRDAKQWMQARAHAALMAEAGALLQGRTPPRGLPGDWRTKTQAFAAAAEDIVSAVDRRDYGAACRGLKAVAASCAGCHQEHR